ncbi:hypothetical protein QZH41_002977 [Actinostola sp. cb2023]|nr:hypothetical protein QZH41_002977 [Actinostola sp. cb2023]
MYGRKHNLEIHGVPEEKEEDLDEVVSKVAECVGVDMEEEDVDIVHRLPVKIKGAQLIRPCSSGVYPDCRVINFNSIR